MNPVMAGSCHAQPLQTSAKANISIQPTILQHCLCPQNAALLFYKRFYIQGSCLEHDPTRVMPTCIYLACKVRHARYSHVSWPVLSYLHIIYSHADASHILQSCALLLLSVLQVTRLTVKLMRDTI